MTTWSEMAGWERDSARKTEVRPCDEDPFCGGDHGPGPCPWIHGREAWALEVEEDGWRDVRASYRERSIRFQAEKMAGRGQRVRVIHYRQPVESADQYEELDIEVYEPDTDEREAA